MMGIHRLYFCQSPLIFCISVSLKIGNPFGSSAAFNGTWYNFILSSFTSISIVHFIASVNSWHIRIFVGLAQLQLYLRRGPYFSLSWGIFQVDNGTNMGVGSIQLIGTSSTARSIPVVYCIFGTDASYRL